MLNCAAIDDTLFYTKQNWSNIYNSDRFKDSILKTQLEQMIVDVYFYLSVEMASNSTNKIKTEKMYIDSVINLLTTNEKIIDLIKSKCKYNSAYLLLNNVKDDNTRYLSIRLTELCKRNDSFKNLIQKPYTKFQYPFFSLTLLLSNRLKRIDSIDPPDDFAFKIYEKISLIIDISDKISNENDIFEEYGFNGLNRKAQLFLTTYILEMHYGLIMSEMLSKICEDMDDNFEHLNISTEDVVYNFAGIQKPLCRLKYIKRLLEIPFDVSNTRYLEKASNPKKLLAAKKVKYLKFLNKIDNNFNDNWLCPLSKDAILLTLSYREKYKERYLHLFKEIEKYISNMELLIPTVPDIKDNELNKISAIVYDKSVHRLIPENEIELQFEQSTKARKYIDKIINDM
ncbi:MAG: hypothetical protein AB9835_11450 [Eubacteriales bacterium]